MPVDASLLMRVNVILSNNDGIISKRLSSATLFPGVSWTPSTPQNILICSLYTPLDQSCTPLPSLCCKMLYSCRKKKATCSAQLQTHQCNIHLYYSVILTRAVRWYLVQLNCQYPAVYGGPTAWITEPRLSFLPYNEIIHAVKRNRWPFLLVLLLCVYMYISR